jgi:hypothetical protein
VSVRTALLLLLGLAACDASTTCSPDGEDCAPLTPYGLEFDGPLVHRKGQSTDDGKLAAGGTARFTLWVLGPVEDGDRPRDPLDMPYVASVDTDRIEVEQDGNVVTVHALADAPDDVTLQVRDADGRPLGWLDLGIAAVAQVTYGIATAESFQAVDPDPVFAPGGPVAIELSDAAGTPLWDESLSVTGAQLTKWDQIAAPAATSTLSVVAAGNAPVDLTIPVATDTIITPEAISETTASTLDQAELHMEARSEGHLVYGSTWSFTGNAWLSSTNWPNIVDVEPPIFTPAGNVLTVVVSAAGASLTIMVTVI